MNGLLQKDKIARFVILTILFLFIFSSAADAAEYKIPYPDMLEEFVWTYGCTPTAASMVLSYWDTTHWQTGLGFKYVGMGRLIDYYYINPCKYKANVPNTIDELNYELRTDYDVSDCSGSGKTDPWRIDDGIRHVTNNINGYNFESDNVCEATWPQIVGDWCWHHIKKEIDNGRPFVWSTGDADFSDFFAGHSVAAWGYTDGHHVILYNTWGYGKVAWYYKYYLDVSDDGIFSSQVNSIRPPELSQRDSSDIILDDPRGGEEGIEGEVIFIGNNGPYYYPIYWYQWGTQIRYVLIYSSLDSGRNWSYAGYWDNPHYPNPSNMFDTFDWELPSTPSPTVRIRLEAYDENNVLIAGDGSFGDFKIIKDTTSPVGSILINGGASRTNNNSVTLTLSCSDNKGADGCECTDMRFSNDNATWTDWEPFVRQKAGTLTDSDGTKTVYVQFRDKVGNISSYSDSIVLDQTGPSATITINNGAAYTTTRSVTINISCASGDCVQMRFSEYDNPVWTSWGPYATTKAWTLSGSLDGQKTVIAEFKDALGNISETSDSIILDEDPPRGTISINDGVAYTTSLLVSLKLTCDDDESGCFEMCLSADGNTWTSWEAISSPRPWTFFGGDGPKKVYVKYRDRVGLESIYSASIFFDSTPPIGSIIINNNEDLTNITNVTLTLSCNDSESGCSDMRFSNDISSWSTWEPFATSKAWNLLSVGPHKRKVYVEYRNGADISIIYSDTINLELLGPIVKEWEFYTGGYVKSSPTVFGLSYQRFLFVGSNDGKVYCLDLQNTTKRWDYPTGGIVNSSPAVAGRYLYVGSNDGKVYCLEWDTGAKVWDYSTGGSVQSSPALAGGYVYVGSYDNKVYCLNAQTGAKVWDFATGGSVQSSPALAGGYVYVGSNDGKVYCLEWDTGAKVWDYSTGGAVNSSPAVAEGYVYVGSYDNKVHCLNAQTGAKVWDYSTGGAVNSSPAVVEGYVYVGSYDNKVYCLNALTGAKVWDYSTGGAVNSSPAVVEGYVYVGSYDNKVYCLNAQTGAEVLLNYPTGGAVNSSPAVVGGYVYVGSDDGRVYCLRGQLNPGAYWPMFKYNNQRTGTNIGNDYGEWTTTTTSVTTTTTTIVPPAAPTGLTATAVSSTRINLSWTDNSNNEDEFYD